ncbi:MAG: hypothetical protein NC831_03620 [Candidatus Omnitrophica bacterium]|nr:hypothetical protein [Candidatus Omnitrophota bacterium]MCM8828138.1 hypothetical protein [Candidatus Omnitrophota bacterium]
MGRRKILIDREIQFKVVIYALIFMVLTSIFISLITFNSVWSILVNHLVSANEKNLTDIFAITFKTFALRITFITIFLAILAGLGMLLVSHRIAGPVYRIIQVVKDLREGKNPSFILRKGDTLSNLMEEIKTFGATHTNLVNASKRVLEIWNRTQVQDISLNVALRELEECFEEKSKDKQTIEKTEKGGTNEEGI